MKKLLTGILVGMLVCVIAFPIAHTQAASADDFSYDVTKWDCGVDCHKDVGAVINSILDDVKTKQNKKDYKDGGKPGAVIYLPPGDYHLKTQVLMDVSFVKIKGDGHGFTSSSIRFNSDTANWHEVWPGGSRILNDIKTVNDTSAKDGAAFVVSRGGDPRLSGIEFENFMIDGVHFVDYAGDAPNAENTYTNRKTGIYVETANDSFCIRNMGFVYLEHGIIDYNADALNITDNFIAECGNGIELVGSGQTSKVTNNFIGTGFIGHSIFAENFNQLSIMGNNVFPRGDSMVRFRNVVNSSVIGNHLHSFYPGMIVLESDCNDNMIASNYLMREPEPWGPMQMYGNGRDDLYGIVQINGNSNSIMDNKINVKINPDQVVPAGASVTVIHIISGTGNYISDNHVTGTTMNGEELPYNAVLMREGVIGNTVLDSGTDDHTSFDKTQNTYRSN